MQIHSVGIDLGKTTFHLLALGAAGKNACAEEVHAEAVAGLHREHADLSDRPGGVLGAHFLGRALHKQRHDVRLIPAQFVKPFVKSNKNDFIDAEAIAEAVKDKLPPSGPPSAGQIVRGGGYLRLRHESGQLHRKIGCEVLMELDGIPDVCNRTRRDRPFWGHHGIMK